MTGKPFILICSIMLALNAASETVQLGSASPGRQYKVSECHISQGIEICITDKGTVEEIDLGNWIGGRKYADLAERASFAESCHATWHVTGKGPASSDFRRSLESLAESGFAGPLALIYDGPDPDEWAGLEIEWEIVRSVFDERARHAAALGPAGRSHQ